VPQTADKKRWALMLRKNSLKLRFIGVLCQGTTSVVPQTVDKKRWALHAAEKLAEAAIYQRFVSGHDFSRAAIAAKSMRASAPAGCSPELSLKSRPSSAAGFAPEGCF
jgi:hypothetical protein